MMESANKKPEKGERGYLDSQHSSSLIRFLLFGAVTLILALCTWIIFPQYGMVFLVLAVISAVPTAMAAVNLIMFFRFKSISEEDYGEIEEFKGNALIFYDSVITTTERSYYAPCIAVLNKNTCVYLPSGAENDKELIRHLTLMGKKNGFKEWNFKVFHTKEELLKRLKYLGDQNIKVLRTDEDMIRLIGNLSL